MVGTKQTARRPRPDIFEPNLLHSKVFGQDPKHIRRRRKYLEHLKKEEKMARTSIKSTRNSPKKE